MSVLLPALSPSRDIYSIYAEGVKPMFQISKLRS